ncbi:hypothetical protein R1sor_008489 [Riccia sorocarpa]|uniref:Uncharacterized protein n=1 Tax=Riccia sorocarpa TaxID=122646 RepID=A0ABD3HTZ6_9MARC
MSGKGKEPTDSGQVEAPAMPRIQLDPDTLQLLQTLKLVLKQEQAEEVKERDATKALRAVVRSLGQFEGKNVSKFLRLYEQEMDVNHVPEEKMISSFALAVVPEMRKHLTQADRTMLGVNKTDLFLRAVEPELQEKLEVRLEDKTTESGLTADWGKVKEEVEQLAKRELAKRELKSERAPIRRFVPAVPVVQEPVAVQPWPVVPKKEDSAMEELLKGEQKVCSA